MAYAFVKDYITLRQTHNLKAKADLETTQQNFTLLYRVKHRLYMGGKRHLNNKAI